MRAILTGSLLLALAAGPAVASDFDGTAPIGFHNHRFSVLPACDAPGVVAGIAERFAYQDAHIIHAGLAVTGVDGVHERAVKAGGPGLVDRRYCGATASLSNGRRAPVAYIIEGPKLGLFSIGWHVESCVAGYDPYRVYDAGCRSIGP